VNWAGTFDPNVLLEELKSKPQDAIIEQIATGSMLRVMLLPSFHQITVMLSGIQCPSIRRGEDGNEDAAPFAREARFFVETRLLHREVKVKLDGVDKSGALFGSVLHPMGNMSIELVKVGLARVVDWSVGYCDFAKELRTAEREAKEKRLRIWRDYVPPNHGNDMTTFTARVAEIVSGDTVVRKPTPPALSRATRAPGLRRLTNPSRRSQVVAEQDGTERRVSLSSVRCPRPPGRDAASNADPTQARENARNTVYAAEAKELLRKTLIGKKVLLRATSKLALDWLPTPSVFAVAGEGGARVQAQLCPRGGAADGAHVRYRLVWQRQECRRAAHLRRARDCGTDGPGAAAARDPPTSLAHKRLGRSVEQTIFTCGVATQSDERSLHYEVLVEAETAASAAKKGLHAPNQPNRSQNIDLSLPTARDRAKSYLSSLQRHGRVRAIVQVRAADACLRLLPAHDGLLLTLMLLRWQFSMNGARFKLLIPKENCVIIFSLAGIRCPQTSRNGSEAEPHADEAYAFSRSQCFQREVDVETEAVDKNGTFFGRCDSPCAVITHPTPAADLCCALTSAQPLPG
jgi:staphylococcal nuclease domain-containing protein 1